MSDPVLEIRSIRESDREWVRSELRRNWGSTMIDSAERCYEADTLPGWIACHLAEPIALLTYALPTEDELEIVTLSSTRERLGVASRLLECAEREARARGCRRIFLLTSNDNLHALGFYQRRGWRLCRLHAGSLDRHRQRRPEIPTVGMNDIELHDELELERDLNRA